MCNRLLFGYEPDMDRNVAHSGMNTLNKRDVVRVAVDDLLAMDRDVLASMRRQQLRKEAHKRLMFSLALR